MSTVLQLGWLLVGYQLGYQHFCRAVVNSSAGQTWSDQAVATPMPLKLSSRWEACNKSRHSTWLIVFVHCVNVSLAYWLLAAKYSTKRDVEEIIPSMPASDACVQDAHSSLRWCGFILALTCLDNACAQGAYPGMHWCQGGCF